jgi:hypothetical protein
MDGLVAALEAQPAEVSADGWIALRALVRERASGFDPQRHVHGFHGPDEWYAG